MLHKKNVAGALHTATKFPFCCLLSSSFHHFMGHCCLNYFIWFDVVMQVRSCSQAMLVAWSSAKKPSH